MKEETREIFKDNLVKMNARVQSVKSKLSGGRLKEKLLKLYFSSHPKIQFMFARFVMKEVVNKNRKKNEDLIRH